MKRNLKWSRNRYGTLDISGDELFYINGSELQGVYMVSGRVLKPASSGYIGQSFKSVTYTP